MVAATPSTSSLDIKVEIVTTDTQETKSMKALLGCGADGLFIDWDCVRKNQLPEPLHAPFRCKYGWYGQ